MKRMLILGGTSSLAKPFIQLALEEGYQITATTRKPDELLKVANINWERLDLESEQSILNFIRSVSKFKFDFIFDFIGKTSNFGEQEIDLLGINNYISSQISNHIYIILKVYKLLTPEGALINISTRSVEHGSFDIAYAASKAAIHNSVFSIKEKLSENQKVINVVSGLVENSTMFKQMAPDNILSHRIRANKELLTVESFANELINLCREKKDGQLSKYSMIKIGPDYD